MSQKCLASGAGPGGSTGHLTVSGDASCIKKQTYDCMLEAICSATGEKLTREEVAQLIETDPLIRRQIEIGIHKNYMARGVKGGIRTTDRKQKTFDEYKENATKKERFLNPYKMPKLRDTIPAPGAERETGNDELFQLSKLKEWLNCHLGQIEEKGKFHDDEYGFLDLFFNIRVNNQFVLFKAIEKDKSLNGHSSVLFKEGKGLTKGQRDFHNARTIAIQRTRNAEAALKASLSSHLELVISPKKLRNIDTSGIMTANRFDLSVKEQKDAFCNAYEKNYYKHYLIAKKCGAKVPNYTPSPHIGQDPYLKNIETKINNARSLRDIGKLLKERPYDFSEERNSKEQF